MNTKKQKTTKAKHVLALAKSKKGARKKILDCTTVVQLPDCNSKKTPCICKVGCQNQCQWACQSICKFGCKPSEKAPPPPKIGIVAKKKSRARKNK